MCSWSSSCLQETQSWEHKVLQEKQKWTDQLVTQLLRNDHFGVLFIVFSVAGWKWVGFTFQCMGTSSEKWISRFVKTKNKKTKASSVFKSSSILHHSKEFVFNAGSRNKSLHRGQLSPTQVSSLPEVGRLSDPPEQGWIPAEVALRIVILPESTPCLFLVWLFSFLDSFFWTEGAKPS